MSKYRIKRIGMEDYLIKEFKKEFPDYPTIDKLTKVTYRVDKATTFLGIPIYWNKFLKPTKNGYEWKEFNTHEEAELYIEYQKLLKLTIKESKV